MGMQSSIRANGYPSSYQDTQIMNYQVPDYMISPIWFDAEHIEGEQTRWLNLVFCNQRQRARSLAAQDIPMRAIIGHECPVPLAVPNPEPLDPGEALTVSDWASRVMANWQGLNLPDRVACWIVVFLSMKVRMIYPSFDSVAAYHD